MIKKCPKIALFLYVFRIYSLKLFAGGELGPRPQVQSSPPGYVPAHQFLNLIYYFNDFRAISVCWHASEIFFGPHVRSHFCGGPCSAEITERA